MSRPDSSKQLPDWRLRFSLFVTLGWVLLGTIYISSVVGWIPFATLDAPSLGGFLEGAFAPLAFLWLVVGFFLQQRQLEMNTATIERQLEQMRRTAEQAEVQARAIAADELHSRQDTFLRIADVVKEQLSTITGFIVTSHQMEKEGWMQEDGGGRDLWTQSGQGDHGAFGRKCFQIVYSEESSPAELFWGTELRAGHSQRFVDAFGRLLRLAGNCDPEGAIADAIREGTHGRIYTWMVDSKPAA